MLGFQRSNCRSIGALDLLAPYIFPTEINLQCQKVSKNLYYVTHDCFFETIWNEVIQKRTEVKNIKIYLVLQDVATLYLVKYWDVAAFIYWYDLITDCFCQFTVIKSKLLIYQVFCVCSAFNMIPILIKDLYPSISHRHIQVPVKTSKIEPFFKIVNGLKPLTISTESSVCDVSQASGCFWIHLCTPTS